MLIVQGKCQFMKELTLDQKELARLQVLNNVLEHRLPMDQAAELMGVTESHAWRILAAYRKEGAAALSHGRRGHIPRPIESTHFTGAMRELGVQQIFARSPQAKGREGTGCRYLPGPVGNRTTPGQGRHYPAGQRDTGAIYPSLRRQFRGQAGTT